MPKFKAQINSKVLSSKFVTWALILGWALNFGVWNLARAQTCSPSTPKVVAHTGEITGSLDSLVTKDGQGIVINNGSITIDLGCFSDHAGNDLRLYVIGRSHGADVSVGEKLGKWQLIPESMPPHYKPYVCTRSECGGYKPTKVAEYCDGKETLPEAKDGCVTGDQWFSLNIDGSANKSYRYVYISSNKGVSVDALEVIAPSQSVDLYVLSGSTSLTTGSGNRLQFIDGVPAGVYNFGASLTGFAPGSYTYVFSCDQERAVPVTGSVTVQTDVVATIQSASLTCSYGQNGSYHAGINITGSAQAGDSVGVVVGPKSILNTNAGGSTSSSSRAYLVALAMLIGLAVIFEIAHRARLKNTNS